MEIWIVWLVIAAALTVVEVLTQMMWALCLAVGAAGATVAAVCGGDIVWQSAVFIVLSAAAYMLFLPWFRRRNDRRSAHAARTGMDALIGRRAVVTHEIKPGGLGRARIDGDSWQVRAPGCNAVVHAGEEVTVTAYDSIILNVERNQNK